MVTTRQWGKRGGLCPCGSGGKVQSECCLPWEETFQRLVARALAFAATPPVRQLEREAACVFGSADEFAQEAEGVRPESRLRFQEWLLLDYTPPRRHGSLLARFADENPDLPSAEALLLLALLLAPVRAYEVSETLGPGGVMLKDLLVGSERRAGPAGVPAELIRSDILIGRFFPLGRLWRPGPTLLRMASPARGELLAYVRTAYQLARPGRHVSVEDFLDLAPHLYHHFFQLRGASFAGREVHTVRDVAFAPGCVRLRGADTTRIRAILDRQPELGAAPASTPARYFWPHASDGVRRVSVVLDEEGVTIQADTREDLAEAQGVLAQALQGLVQGAERQEVPSGIPPCTAEKGVREPAGKAFLDRVLASWAETRLPLLSDQTPVEACRSRGGRQHAAALLTELERDLARQKRLGRAWMDIEWLWSRLGVATPSASEVGGSGTGRGSTQPAPHGGQARKANRRERSEHRTGKSRR